MPPDPSSRQDAGENATLLESPPAGSDLSLTASAKKGGAALLGRQIANALIRLVASVVLARLLVPDEFGVAAMGAAFAGLPQAVGDLGLGAYLIQADRSDRALIARVYRLNLAVSLWLALALAGLGFLAPLFYGDDRVRGVVWVSAMGFPLRALWAVHEKILRKQLNFQKLAVLQSLEAILLAVLAVLLGTLGFSYWSLVIPGPLGHLLIAPFYWRASALPPFPGSSERHDRTKGLMSFGAYSTGNSLLTYIVNNADYLLIGRLLDAASLGLYTFAYTKSFMFSKSLLTMASDVALPVMSAAKQQKERLKRGVQQSLILMALANLPVSVFLAVSAPVLIPWVFGIRWEGAILPFQILLVHVAVNAMASPIGSVAYAIGRPDLNFRVVAPMVPVLLVAYYVGVRLGGIVGVAVAISVVKSAASLLKLRLVLHSLGWKVGEVAGRAMVLVLVCVLAGLPAWAVRLLTGRFPPLFCLAAVLAVFAGGYLTLALLAARQSLALGWETVVPERVRKSTAGVRVGSFLAGTARVSGG